MSEEKKASTGTRRGLPWWAWLLISLGAAVFIGALIWGWARPRPTTVVETEKEVTRIVEAADLNTPTPTEVVPTSTPAPANTPAVNTREPFVGTLDDFGRKVRYDDRFPTDGQVWDQSYNEGEIFVANMWAVHDNTFKSQEGCVVVYHRASVGGSRIRFTAWNGQGFELNADSGVTLNQAIAAMRETLVRAHGCAVAKIQYHEAIRYGDPVK